MKNLLLYSLAIYAYSVFGQQHKVAIAFPIEDIKIDGSLVDWPDDVSKYQIENLAFGNIEDDTDLSAFFSLAYSTQNQKLFVSVTVIDEDHQGNNTDHNIESTDRLLLYIDPIHDKNLGPSVIFEAGEKLKQLSTKPIAWSLALEDLNWDKVEYATQRNSKSTVYEWALNLGNHIKENNVLGFDLIVADVDEKEESSTWLLWKTGTAKSETGFRLGEIILAQSKEKLATIHGTIENKEQYPNLNTLVIASKENEDLWVRADLDSMGSFSATLPFSRYEISPYSNYSSPIFSGEFNQNTKQIILQKEVSFELDSKRSRVHSSIKIKDLPIPLVGKQKGLLFTDEINENKIDAFIETCKDYFQIPGVSIALIKDKKVIYDKVFGVKNNLTQEPLKTHSLFEAASISKPVFSMMVLKMAENGEIDLDKPLYQYLAFPNLENDPNYKFMTARHVLNHRSGLENWPLGSYSGFIPDNNIKLQFKPGERYLYSGEAMNYLGRVVEKIKGEPLHHLFDEEIKSAFGLENTFFHFTDSLEQDMALGHYHKTTFYKYKYNNVNSPASSLISEASDFSNVIVGLLEGRYLNPTSYEIIFNIHKEMEDDQKLYDTSSKQGIGHGFFVTESPVGKIVAHGGNNGDYDCLFMMMPEYDLGFVIFTNSNLGDEFNRLMTKFLILGSDGT